MTFIDKHNAALLIKCSPHTLNKWRLDGTLIEGVHWVAYNQRVTRYDKEMLQHWAENRHQPWVHLARVEEFLKESEQTN
jgi:hypothetical protein